ncbi:15782_t:CDS:2, partial [Racocetra persica]
AQIALQKKPNNDNVHRSHSQQCLGLPSTRSRSSSRSSNVSNWLMNHCSSATSGWECGCGYCILCLAPDNMSIIESRPASTRTTPRPSRRNSVSVSSRQKCQKCLNYGIPDIPEENSSSFNKKQHQLAILKRLYRHQLEHKSDYKKSCENLELELQKFVSTALMDSYSCDDHETIDGFTCHKCRNDLFVEAPKKEVTIWRKRIWNYLKEKILPSPLISSTTSYNSEEILGDDFVDFTHNNWSNYYDEYSNSSSHSSYSHDTRNDDDSTPFPSSFGQNIFCNVNIDSKENKVSKEDMTRDAARDVAKDVTKNVKSISKQNIQSITKRCMNLLAIIGVLVGILQNGFIPSKRNGNLNFNSKRTLIRGPILLDIISRALYTKKNRSVKSKRDMLVMMG